MSGSEADTVSGPPDVGEVVRVGPFAAGSRTLVIDSNVPEMAEALADRLRDLRRDVVGDDPTVLLVARTGPAWLTHPWGVWRDGEPCQTTITPDYITAYVLWEVTRLALESSSPLVPVHAGAVVHEGRALVLAGVSHAGKSTLSGWLTAHGWAFLTDEVAFLEPRPDGTTWVHPFWRPIGVRRPSPLDGLYTLPNGDSEVLVPASELGPLADPAPLAAIVFPRYQSGVTASLEAQHPAAAVRELASHLPTLGTGGASVFRAIVGVVERTPAYRLDVDDLDEATGTLRALVAEGHA